ncbi:MAG: class I SAM-dependent methyltransferase [Gammaproteobacteria bacterium]|nr:class I SAM-dependent methyltransferase [Gammaproteobacteria bacterium]
MEVNNYICRKLDVTPVETLPYTGKIDAETNRTQLAELFCELGFKIGAELGVFYGAYSEVLLKSNPGLKLYCIDPWVSRSADDRRGRWFVQHIKKILKQYDFEIIRKVSRDALQDIPDGSLDFVYIDAAHDFDNVIFDIIEWSKKVRAGGIVSGHDYFNLPKCEAVYAVDAYTRAHKVNPWFITKDFPPSWYWVKC